MSRAEGPGARVIFLPIRAGVHCEWPPAISAWATALVAAGRTEQTVALRRYQLERLAAWVAPRGPWEVDHDLLTAFLATHRWRPATLRSYRAALRGFYRWAVLTDRVAASPAASLPSPGITRPNPRPAPDDVYTRALAAAPERVRLMLRLAAELGLRRGEVARVHLRDLTLDRDGWSLLVHGKGGRERILPVPDLLAETVRRVAREGGGYAFPGADDGHLSARWVGKLAARYLPPPWTMHTLRHRFAARAWAVDHDLLTVQELLGHASPATTRHYVPGDESAKRRLVLAVSA